MVSAAAHARHLGRFRKRPRGVWLIYALMGTLLAAYIVLLATRPVGQGSTAIEDWGAVLFELTASALCILGGLRRRPGSVAPVVLGLGLACWSLGDLVLTIESLGGVTPASPSLADAFYLAFFPVSYVAVVLFIRGETRRLSSPNWLDGAVAGLGASAVCAAFAFRTIEHTAHESTLAVAINVAYPIGDVLMLLLVVGGTAIMSGRRRAPWLLLAAGFTVNVFGDTSNLLQASSFGASHLGTVANAAAWPISTLLMSIAMWLRPGLADPLAPRRPPSFLLPGLAAGAGLTVLFVRTLSSVNRVATGLATATLVLVVLRTWLSVRHLRTQTKVRQQQSITDHLTGLANRRRMFDALDAVFAEPPGERPKLAFLFIDLNGFKRVNDSFGHAVGDEILKRVSARLVDSLRQSDLLARVGGDEFAAMLVGAGADEAIAVAAHLSSSLDEPFTLDAVSANISASIGIALAPGDASDSPGLMRCADTAMYRAKLGSSPFACYEPTLDRGGNKLRLADQLSAAIDADELVLYYQPQLDLRDDQIRTVEALVRWRHPEHGLIGPSAFLPLAEEAGMMDELTRWVLAQALAECSAWRAAGRELRVSVNVAAVDLTDPEFPGTVGALLARERLSPDSLVLEITETSIIEEFERARDAVGRLRELGVQVSIDDFGAGFTSLAYLDDLAVGEMKLDRRFITPLAGGVRSRDAELVRATIELGHALGLQVVAEGVEDSASLELLRELGCDIAQGFGIGPPVPAAELELDRDHAQSRLPPGGTTHSRRANSSDASRSSSQTRPAPAPAIARASSVQARATPPTRAVGPQPVAEASSAARARTSSSVNSPNDL
ncbi:MAG: putative bifunctional diguanylate cyclase/phosphodiesterase [Solirubrobacteraceae bacterium]